VGVSRLGVLKSKTCQRETPQAHGQHLVSLAHPRPSYSHPFRGSRNSLLWWGQRSAEAPCWLDCRIGALALPFPSSDDAEP